MYEEGRSINHSKIYIRECDVNTLKNTLSDVVLGNKYNLPVKQKEVSISSDFLEKYVGTYQISPDLKIAISKEDNQLSAQLSGQEKVKIYPETETF